MKQSLQDAIENKVLPDADYPDFEPGDRIRVTTYVDIGGQKRPRHFEGTCIARRGEGPDQTFKVRKVSFGVGVERIFPLYSPSIQSIEVLRKGKVRRAKLNYLEGRSARESRIEERRADLDAINAGPQDAGEEGAEASTVDEVTEEASVETDESSGEVAELDQDGTDDTSSKDADETTEAAETPSAGESSAGDIDDETAEEADEST